MSIDKSIGRSFQGDDDVPPIIWPLMKEIWHQMQTGGEVTIIFNPTDQLSIRETEALSEQLRAVGIKLIIDSGQDKNLLE